MNDLNPIREFATDVVRQLTDGGYTALWAGGCVRDLMLGRVPQDYDVATDARPDQVRELFGQRKTLAVGESFGVIIVLGPNKAAGQVEVATFRTEGEYGDGRRPDSVAFCTPEEDARRRDFTINGMFYDPLSKAVHDYVGGEKDLGRGIVRAIGEPRDRMNEDKLRMLRAVRFTATLEFELDEKTADAVRDMAREILVVSWERIAQELKKMLVDSHRERAMRLCHDLDLLPIILPELHRILPPVTHRDWPHTLHILGNLDGPSFELATAALLHTVPSPIGGSRKSEHGGGTVRGICRRLKLSNDETDRISWLVAHLHALDEAQSLPLSVLKPLLARDDAADLLTLSRLRTLAERGDLAGIEFAAEYRERTQAEVLDPPPLINGSDLQQLGVPSGPQFKQILDAVRDEQLNEQITTHAAAIALAKSLIAEG